MQLARSLLTSKPTISGHLLQDVPALAPLLTELATHVPIPESAMLDTEQHFYRLPNHNRSFCYSLAEDERVFQSAALIVKGTEPLLGDFELLLEWLAQTPFRRSSLVMADHFSLSEGKIPGGLSRIEAVREFAISAQVQSRYQQFYGELAPLPVPLFVHHFSPTQNARTQSRLESQLSAAAFERVAPLLESGLAVYTYFYRTAPIRANVRGNGGGPKLRAHVAENLDVERATLSWVRLIVRLLYLGYLPYTLRNQNLGACMDFGNATIDGGFCDPDSIVPMESCPDDEFFYSSLVECLAILHNTVSRMAPESATYLYPGIEDFCLSRWLERSFEAMFASEARPGLTLDSRVHHLFAPESYQEVLRCTARKQRPSLYPAFLKRKAIKR